MSDTIFALATGADRAALAVVRVSGSNAGAVLDALAGRRPSPRRATVRRLVDPVSRETLDQALILWMPGPGSFTGEDVVELHLHGGRAVSGGVLAALTGLGLRMAEPGEFTRRAFERGKLDLTEAEAIADLVDAESAAQRKQALAQLDGATSQVAERWHGQLLRALAVLEAAIDFPDEEVPEAVAEEARAPLNALWDELAAAADDTRGERVREGYRIALVGAPNAGKSSILNALVDRDVAIVTELAGTTRDVIEQPMALAGYYILLADTAGLRDAEERIEAEGVRRARAWAEVADLRLWIVDASANDATWNDAVSVLRQRDMLVLNKTDLAAGVTRSAVAGASDTLELELIEASALSPDGMIELRQALERRVVADLASSEPLAVTRLRHRRLYAEAAEHVSFALARPPGAPELMAEDVRLAARTLERLAGKIDAEAVLGEIFSSFCIGK